MKEIISFPLLLTGFLLLSGLLHQAVLALGLFGVWAFLIYCLPMLLVISYTTAENYKDFGRIFLRYTFCGYCFILSIAGLVRFIG